MTDVTDIKDNYLLQRALYDFLRHGDMIWADERFDALPGPHRESLKAHDLRRLAEFDVHPVLINAFARAVGQTRDDYRRVLAGTSRGADLERTPRWRAS
jgi:hypothetical protein